MAVAPDTTLLPFAQVVAFARSELTEQTTPVSFTVMDALASVSNVTFVDKDLDADELGGISQWVEPGTPALERVVLYKRSSEDSTGARRLLVVAGIVAGTNHLWLTPKTPLLAFTQPVCYTRSSLVEQTTVGKAMLLKSVDDEFESWLRL